MANSYVEYTASGTSINQLGQTTFQIPFNYITIADVNVKGITGSTKTDLTIASTDANAKTVTLSAIPTGQTTVRLYRSTSTAQLVDFQNGSRLSETDLDTAYQQGLFVAQEVSEDASLVTAVGTSNVSLSGTTTFTGTTTGLDVNGTDIILDADGDSKIEASTDDVVAIHTGGSERLRIDNEGNVGVGTSSPNIANFGSALTITDSAVSDQIPAIELAYGSNTRGANIAVDNRASVKALAITGVASDLAMTFGTNNTERMRIDNDGRLLINTTSSFGAGFQNILFDGTTFNAIVTKTTRSATGSNFAVFMTADNSLAGNINHSGTYSVSYLTSSDYRLKENVADISDGITRVKQLSPKRFNWINDESTTVVDGFLAHEAQAVVPESVTGTKDEVDDEGNPVMQGIDQAKLVPLLTAALQEAIAKIEVLETKVAALEA